MLLAQFWEHEEDMLALCKLRLKKQVTIRPRYGQNTKNERQAVHDNTSYVA